jgi:thymidylate synthase (FAD)
MEDSILFEKPKVRLIAATYPLDEILTSAKIPVPEEIINEFVKNAYDAAPEQRDKLIKEFLNKVRIAEPSPDLISTAGALGCFEEASSVKFLGDLMVMPEDARNKKVEGVLANSAGKGHGSVLDQDYFIFSIGDLPRAATLQLCLPEYLSHLQQSLRRAKADRGFYIPSAIKESKLFNEVKKTLFEAFNLYNEMNQDDKPEGEKTGIPGEDARYHLPLYTKTNIQTGGDVREWQHLHAMNNRGEVPSIVKETIDAIIAEGIKVAPAVFKNREKNYETLAWRPSAQLFSSENRTLEGMLKNYDSGVSLVSYSGFPVTEQSIFRAVKERNEAELSNLKHIHFEFLVPMSLVTYHQATRQRTWNHSLESIYHAVQRGNIITPPSIENSPFKEKYKNINERMLELYERLIGYGVPRAEAIGVVPHSLQIYDFIHVDGWNAIHSIGKRTCTNAQWEIRGIANKMADYIKKENPVLGEYAVPQGIIYGKCPEKKSCGYCDKVLEKAENKA